MEKTKVFILGVMHGLHNENKLYSYEDIFKEIEKFEPEVIGVEIRPEDINERREYLDKFYPYEMNEAKFRFENICKICGFDWLGEKGEGKLLWDGYFEEKNDLEKAFEIDDKYEKERAALEVINEMRFELILSSNAKEINNGQYDKFSKMYYKQLNILFKDTPYEAMGKFYENRDEHIGENIKNIINVNRGKKILLLMGLDHRVFAIESIKKGFGEDVIFVSIQ